MRRVRISKFGRHACALTAFLPAAAAEGERGRSPEFRAVGQSCMTSPAALPPPGNSEDQPMMRERKRSCSAPAIKERHTQEVHRPSKRVQVSRRTILLSCCLIAIGLGAWVAHRSDIPAKVLHDYHVFDSHEVLVDSVGTSKLKQSFSAGQALMEAEAAENPVPRVCVLVRTYAAQLSSLPILLLSLFHIGFPDLQIFLVNTEVDIKPTHYRAAVDLANELSGRSDFVRTVPVAAQGSGQDWGYASTDLALDYLYNTSHGCEYVLFTNGDNFYAKGFAHHLLRPFADKAHIIAVDYISHQNYTGETLYTRYPDSRTTEVDAGTYHLLRTELKPNLIDLGAALFRYHFLKKNNLKFASDRKNQPPYSELSDGHFIEKAKALATKSWVLRSVLYLHQ